MNRSTPIAMLAGAGLASASCSGPALAHATERAFVLLLPTGHYLVGGALVVAATFGLIGLVPRSAIERAGAPLTTRLALPRLPPTAISMVSAAILLALIGTGFLGPRDPTANLLPLSVWSLWWVGFVILQAIAGDLWSVVNPWIGPHRAWVCLTGKDRLASYPARLGCLPALALFAAFGWFELVDPAPSDPDRLALAVAAYAALTYAGMVIFGARAWLAHGEPFTIFLALVGRLSVLGLADDGSRRLTIGWPGAALLRGGSMSPTAAALVLLVLATVSFDGLSETFWWLGRIGENPLEHPGRTALIGINSFGLAGLFVVMGSLFALAVAAGLALAGQGGAGKAIPALVVSLVPIALGYHLAHYLTALMLDGQYWVIAVAGRLGLGHWHATGSFLAEHHWARFIWNIQSGSIVIAHVIAVVLGHALMSRVTGSARSVFLAQLPLAVLMVGYTLFGLWLLSSPAAT